MNAIASATGTPISTPSDFPVDWARPEFAAYHWTRDREHLPDPVTPMFLSCAREMGIESRRRAAVYDEAIVERYDIPINHYLYTCLLPFSGTPEELDARARRNREKVGAVSARLPEVWETEWQPALASAWAFWATFDLEAADTPALGTHLEESLARGAQLYEIHYLMGPPMWFAIDAFESAYCDLFPGKTRLDAHRLLQGFDNKTLEMGRALWHLRDVAATCPFVRRVLADLPAVDVCAALTGFEEGERFLDELRAFLAAYGRRSDLWDWGHPSWEDDPTPVINNVKNYLSQPERDLWAELDEAAARREAAVDEARRTLAGYPQPVADRFERLLASAQTALVLTENHTYYIDFNGFGWIHRVIHTLGARFATAGRLDRPDDVFYLHLDELRAMIADPSLDRSAVARQRRAEVARWAACDEPRELGVRPAEALYLYSPDARRMLRYVGGFAVEAAPPPPKPGVLYGQAGSPGTVRGPARVVLTLADAHRLQPGDVLVTRTTAPPWTPLFLTAAAVVTDAGGLLSHGAVVSREYGIPAVVGTHSATALIADGQLVEVDGSNGEVRLV
ncbi:MAG: hypothetical protein JXD18_09510 [Anaerolineae bacterium]|nr:hypothetical protein [Anaerolineae bacterium]